MVGDIRPELVIVDPLYAVYEKLEKTGGEANKELTHIRKLIDEFDLAGFVGIHHLRKPGSNEKAPPKLEECGNDVHRWFHEARGGRVLINNPDIRLGIDKTSKTGADLILAGFERFVGTLPNVYLYRDGADDEGNPLGYKQLTGRKALTRAQREFVNRLPDDWFTTKEGIHAYGKAPATYHRHRKAAEQVGAMKKDPRTDKWRRVSPDETNDSPWEKVLDDM